jgi:Putative auto-transporter adhesin, head GIN domain
MPRTSLRPLVAVPLLWVACAALAQAASEDRPVGAFSKLIVSNGIDVYLTQGDAVSVRIEVEGYELDDIVSEVFGDQLQLSNRKKNDVSSSNDGDVQAYITFVNLSDIEVSGGSDVAGENEFKLDHLLVKASGGSDVGIDVQAQMLTLQLTGGSDVGVSGVTQTLTVDAKGGCDVDAGDLQAERVTVSAGGGSDTVIRASAAVTIEAYGGSDIVVHGNPAERAVDNDRSSDVAWR